MSSRLDLPAGMNRGAAWRAASSRIDRLDARLLLEHVCRCRHTELLTRPEIPLAAAEAEVFAALVARREAGEPLAYLTGSTGFYGHTFTVSPAVLIPRPDTELLVDLGLERVADMAAPRIADLGTGSGCIALSLSLARPDARVWAVDASAAALAVARENGRRLSPAVTFLEGSWFAPLAGERFHLVVSNPPYVAAGDPHLALNGLPFEPASALSDGGDGLACLRAIVAAAPPHLEPGGWLLLEHGYDQAGACRELLAAAGFQFIGSWRDLAGIERVSGGRKPD